MYIKRQWITGGITILNIPIKFLDRFETKNDVVNPLCLLVYSPLNKDFFTKTYKSYVAS